MTAILVTRVSVRRKGYNPDQPRDPAGTPTGGQWTSGGGTAAVTDTVRAAIKRAKPEFSDSDVTQILDVMTLDRERFVYYAKKLGIEYTDEMVDQFFKEIKDAESARLREEWYRQRNLTPTIDGGKTYHSSLSDEMYQIAERKRPERAVGELATTLRDQYGVELVNLNGTPEARVTREVSALLNLADANPAVAQVLRDKAAIISYQKRPRADSTATAAWLDGVIQVYPASDFVQANDGVMPFSTWIHELGHGAQDYVAFDQWRAAADSNERRVSIYAFSNPNEDFAETFTMLYGGRAEVAEAWVPERARFIRKHMPWEKKQ